MEELPVKAGIFETEDVITSSGEIGGGDEGFGD